MTDPIHRLDKPEKCYECKGSGLSSDHYYPCMGCNGYGYFPIGWYFWNEIWVDRIGPYRTKEKAKNMLRKYAMEL